MTDPSEPQDEQLPADIERRIAAVEEYLANASQQSSQPLPTGVVIHLRPWFWSAFGILLGVVAVAAWALTFEPHGGRELSLYLFPGSRWLIHHLYPHESVPVLVWYSCAFLHWPIVGAVIDILRLLGRRITARINQE